MEKKNARDESFWTFPYVWHKHNDATTTTTTACRQKWQNDLWPALYLCGLGRVRSATVLSSYVRAEEKGLRLKWCGMRNECAFFFFFFFRCCVSDRRAFNLIYLYACAHSLNKIYHKINAHDIAEIFFSPNCVSGPYYYLCMRLSHRIDILCSKTKKTKNFIFFWSKKKLF